jgi:hypothetical protein
MLSWRACFQSPYVPELRNSALNTATLSASVALSFDGYSGSGLVPLMRETVVLSREKCIDPAEDSCSATRSDR